MSVAFLFPGQGSQVPGMLHALPDHPAISRTLEEASDTLSSDVRLLDSEAALRSTVSVQIALVTAGVSVARALLDHGLRPHAVAGLSVGAFAAVVIAGVVSFRDALALVRLRAEQMESLYPAGYGMSAIVGLTESQVSRIVQTVSMPREPVYIANSNAPRQIVISGSNPAMDRVLEEALRHGARKAERLSVSVPSHCPLLQPAADALAERISSCKLSSPTSIYVSNVKARALRTPSPVADDLAQNIAHQVGWHDATTVLQELGCNLLVEMPPGHVLTDLANENLPGITALAVESGALPRILRLAQQAAD